MKLWEMRYGDEPVDGRLFLLRFVGKIHIVIISVIIGALFVCGCHVLYRALTPAVYMTEADLHLDYIPEADANLMIVYNEYAWEQMSQDSAFTDAIASADASLDREEIKASFLATLKSDNKVLTLQVKNTDPELCLKIADAAVIGGRGFVENLPEITGTEIIGMPYTPTVVSFGTRAVRALVLGAILGFFVSAFILSYIIISDDRIFLPETIEKRYHTPCAGTENSPALADSLSDLAGDDGFVIASTLPAEKITDITEKLKKAGVSVSDKALNLINPEEKDTVAAVKEITFPVVYVFSSLYDMKADQRALSLLSRFDKEPMCAILADPDEALINAYYLGRRSRYAKAAKEDREKK